MFVKLWTISFLCFVLLNSASWARTWKDKTGDFSVDAEMVGIEGDIVLLRTVDGRDLRVPVEKLGSTDRIYVARQRKIFELQAANAKRAEDPGDLFPESPLKVEVKAVEIVREYPKDNVAIPVHDKTTLTGKGDAKLAVVHVRVTAMRPYSTDEEKAFRENATPLALALVGKEDLMFTNSSFLLGRLTPDRKLLELDECQRVWVLPRTDGKQVKWMQLTRQDAPDTKPTGVVLSPELGAVDLALVFPHIANNKSPILTIMAPNAGEKSLTLQLELDGGGKLASFARYVAKAD